MRHHLNNKNFVTSSILTLLLAAGLSVWIYNMGKEDLFLLLNTDAGRGTDLFFMVFTFFGDGFIWLPALLITLFLLKRKDSWILLVAAFVLSTILVQGIKNFVFNGAPRPIKAITNTHLIHTVSGVDVHTIGSFPSGHTTTAFCIYFIFCLLLPGRWWILIGFIYAALVGYSRIYLAQHFPSDVAAGMVIAIVAVWAAKQLQQYYWKQKSI